MGRIFEVRKATMFKRFDRMAKQFTRIGKEIVIAVKAGGPNPDDNPALRRCYQNARSAGMPKDRVEAAIKRAMGKDTSNYEEILYEGYAPHGVALLVETATSFNPLIISNEFFCSLKNCATKELIVFCVPAISFGYLILLVVG